METIRELLDVKRTEILAEMAGLEAPAEDSGGIGFGKRVGDGTSVAVERIAQVAAHDRLQVLLRDVARASAKLDDGSYGQCDVCRTTIPAPRLDALPWATRCVGCAAGG